MSDADQRQDLVSILNGFRAHYMDFYLRVIRKLAEEPERCVPEVLLQIGGREELPEMFQLYRVDILRGSNEQPQVSEVNHDRLPVGPDVRAGIGDLEATISPLLWNGDEFLCDSFDPRDAAFAAWMIMWMDPDDENPPDEDGLGGCIHSVTWPEPVGDAVGFSIDFGSAPAEALVELLGILSGSGTKSVTVGAGLLPVEPNTQGTE